MINLSDLLGGGGWRSKVFLSSGTFSPPSTVTPVEALVIGGGQAGSYTGTPGAPGGSSSFGNTIASGGNDTTGYGKRILFNGGYNDAVFGVVPGAPGFADIGNGGPGERGGLYTQASGGASGAVEKYSGIPGSTSPITITVGAGGGTGNMQGCNGAVIVCWRE